MKNSWLFVSQDHFYLTGHMFCSIGKQLMMLI